MTVQQNNLRGVAGTSFTKAVTSICRVEMRPVVHTWSKQTTGSGSQA
jgi:hypothetical protein